MTCRVIAAALVLMTVFGARTAEASEDDGASDELALLAAETGVDPVALAGAVDTVGVPPRRYLEDEGLLQRPAPVSASTIWDRLAQCESNSRWAANTGNGYYGGLQEDMTFWRSHGGLAYAARPDLASRVAQIAVAERGLATQGWGAWPVCSRVIGTR
jgi:hypothetical protein